MATLLIPGSAGTTYTDAEAISAVEGEATLDLSGIVTIANNQGLVVGHTAQLVIGEVTSEAQILGTTETDASLVVGLFSATDALAALVKLYKSGSGSIGANFTTVADNEELGKIQAYGADGTDADTLVAEIAFNVDDDSVATGQIGGEIILATATSAGVLTTAVTISSTPHLTIFVETDILHTAAIADDHALELDVDAAGFGDVKAIDVDYITGAISAGEDEGVILVNIDEIAATGGDVVALEVLATEGSATVEGMKVGVGIAPVHQDSGLFINPTTGTDNTDGPDDVAAMIDGNSGTTTAIFEADNEFIIIGADAAFEELEFILTTGASGGGIKPTIAYSTTGAGQFTTFSPVDGTNGFKNTGVMSWSASDLTGHTTNDDTGTFDIKITRTQNTVTTTPVLGFAKTAATTEFIWDKDGNLNLLKLSTDTIAESTSAAGVTIDSVLLKDGVVTVGDVAFDDATSDPLPADATAAADGVENSVARKDHRHFATAASATVQGIAELATAAETSTGSDTARVVPVVALPIQIQDSKYVFVADTASDDTYLIALTPAVTAYATGQVFHFTAQTKNTGAATLNVNGLGAKTIKKQHDLDLANDDIEAGQIVTVIYDGTVFQMQSQIGNNPSSTDTDAIHDNVASEITVITEKTAPVGNDEIIIEDSADTNAKKSLKLSNLEKAQTSRKFSYAITVEDPTSSEDISIAFTNRAITATEIRAVLIGSSTPSVTWTIRHDPDRNATGNEIVTGGTATTSVTTGSDVTSFNDDTIPADSFIWLETTAQSGTVPEINITIIGSED